MNIISKTVLTALLLLLVQCVACAQRIVGKGKKMRNMVVIINPMYDPSSRPFVLNYNRERFRVDTIFDDMVVELDFSRRLNDTMVTNNIPHYLGVYTPLALRLGHNRIVTYIRSGWSFPMTYIYYIPGAKFLNKEVRLQELE